MAHSESPQGEERPKSTEALLNEAFRQCCDMILDREIERAWGNASPSVKEGAELMARQRLAGFFDSEA